MIVTKRLILRPFVEEDVEDVFEYLREIDVNCFASMKLNSLEEARKEINNRINDKEFYFAITLKDSNKVIGELFGHPESSNPDEEGALLDTFSPCWIVNKKYQGHGYAYEAAKAYFDYLFHEKGIRRMYAFTEDYNISSQKLCEKLGMRKEGVFMEYISFVNDENGQPCYENTIQYAILKREWKINRIG